MSSDSFIYDPEPVNALDPFFQKKSCKDVEEYEEDFFRFHGRKSKAAEADVKPENRLLFDIADMLQEVGVTVPFKGKPFTATEASEIEQIRRSFYENQQDSMENEDNSSTKDSDEEEEKTKEEVVEMATKVALSRTFSLAMTRPTVDDEDEAAAMERRRNIFRNSMSQVMNMGADGNILSSAADLDRFCGPCR